VTDVVAAGIARITERLVAFVSGVPIGSPGGVGGSSQRGYDTAPMAEFAWAQGLLDASADEIYAAFVEDKTRQAELQMRGDAADDDTAGTDGDSVAQRLQFAASHALQADNGDSSCSGGDSRWLQRAKVLRAEPHKLSAESPHKRIKESVGETKVRQRSSLPACHFFLLLCLVADRLPVRLQWLFVIKCEGAAGPESNWMTRKRYSDFEALRERLVEVRGEHEAALKVLRSMGEASLVLQARTLMLVLVLLLVRLLLVLTLVLVLVLMQKDGSHHRVERTGIPIPAGLAEQTLEKSFPEKSIFGSLAKTLSHALIEDDPRETEARARVAPLQDWLDGVLGGLELPPPAAGAAEATVSAVLRAFFGLEIPADVVQMDEGLRLSADGVGDVVSPAASPAGTTNSAGRTERGEEDQQEDQDSGEQFEEADLRPNGSHRILDAKCSCYDAKKWNGRSCDTCRTRELLASSTPEGQPGRAASPCPMRKKIAQEQDEVAATSPHAAALAAHRQADSASRALHARGPPSASDGTPPRPVGRRSFDAAEARARGGRSGSFLAERGVGAHGGIVRDRSSSLATPERRKEVQGLLDQNRTFLSGAPVGS